MINAGSSALNQKWKDVLHNQSEDYIIPESDVNVTCPYDSMSLTGYTVTSNANSVSNTSVLAKGNYTTIRDKKVATFEWNFWVLDGSFDVLDDGETYNGFLSNAISDNNCEYETNPYVFFDTSTSFNMRKNQTLKFAPSYDEVPAQISIFGANTQETKTYYFNIEETLETDDIINQEYVHLYSSDIDTSFSALRIGVAFQKSLMPFRRARLTEYNNGYKFFLNKYDLQSFVHTRTCKLSMEELPQNDLEISFADIEKIFDDKYNDAPFHINFNKNHRFLVYYGYNFDDIGWNYVQADLLALDTCEYDKGSLVTTLKLQSTLNLYEGTYGTGTLRENPSDSRTPPFDWNDFNGFLMAICSKLGISNFNIGSQTIPNWETDKSYWQSNLRQSFVLEESNANVTLKELIQQICAILGCVLVRQSDGSFYLNYWLGSPTSAVDYTEATNIFEYPSVQKGERYKKITLSTPRMHEEQEDDSAVSIDLGQLGHKTLEPYVIPFVFSSVPDTSGEQELTETIVPVGFLEDANSWQYDSDLFYNYATYYWNAVAGTLYEFNDLLLNPLLQVSDVVYANIGSGYNQYGGRIEKIEINYDGSFRGTLTLNGATFVI